MSSQYEKRQIAKLNDMNKKRKLRKTRQKLGYKDDKENNPMEEEADEDWGNSINTTRSSLRSKVSTKNSPKKNVQKDKSADLNRSSGSTRASRAAARRSEEWQVSNVSSEGNKNEDAEESSVTTDRLVIDETEEVDPIQEAKRVREEINEMKAKMDEEAKRSEEESKKKLAEMKEQAAKRKAERKAKQEERRRQLEAEEESSSISVIVSDQSKS